jgi:hypothetical protein
MNFNWELSKNMKYLTLTEDGKKTKTVTFTTPSIHSIPTISDTPIPEIKNHPIPEYLTLNVKRAFYNTEEERIKWKVRTNEAYPEIMEVKEYYERKDRFLHLMDDISRLLDEHSKQVDVDQVMVEELENLQQECYQVEEVLSTLHKLKFCSHCYCHSKINIIDISEKECHDCKDYCFECNEEDEETDDEMPELEPEEKHPKADEDTATAASIVDNDDDSLFKGAYVLPPKFGSQWWISTPSDTLHRPARLVSHFKLTKEDVNPEEYEMFKSNMTQAEAYMLKSLVDNGVVNIQSTEQEVSTKEEKEENEKKNEIVYDTSSLYPSKLIPTGGIHIQTPNQEALLKELERWNILSNKLQKILSEDIHEGSRLILQVMLSDAADIVESLCRGALPLGAESASIVYQKINELVDYTQKDLDKRKEERKKEDVPVAYFTPNEKEVASTLEKLKSMKKEEKD